MQWSSAVFSGDERSDDLWESIWSLLFENRSTDVTLCFALNNGSVAMINRFLERHEQGHNNLFLSCRL